ncbi:hypothetical protein THAOC_00987 [Thalassiosira oceanica]|uniref:Uncharacterized protein n=1 Tax=Thalassiosira oceanica TaxID=159749 RepID=K0TR53_THAOC|nr:hypothetical protein THAOC_00987 [Thalassiosira oceanica]|eukprot:EJK77197.1 hypothetical protein THAOC_00987 [Thalassiosira oceanica]
MSISAKAKPKKSAAKKSASAKRLKRTRSPKRRTKDANHDEVDVKFNGFEGRLVEEKLEEKLKGVKISNDDDAYVRVEIINNGRGNPVRVRRVVKVRKNQVRCLGVQDMLNAVDHDGEEEDEEAVEFDRSTWECTECGGLNTNDGSNCTNLPGTLECLSILLSRCSTSREHACGAPFGGWNQVVDCMPSCAACDEPSGSPRSELDKSTGRAFLKFDGIVVAGFLLAASPHRGGMYGGQVSSDGRVMAEQARGCDDSSFEPLTWDAALSILPTLLGRPQRFRKGLVLGEICRGVHHHAHRPDRPARAARPPETENTHMQRIARGVDWEEALYWTARVGLVVALCGWELLVIYVMHYAFAFWAGWGVGAAVNSGNIVG